MLSDREIIERYDTYYGGCEDCFGQVPSNGLVDYLSGKNCRGKRALDLGCGTGRNSIFLAKLGFEVTAVDRSQEAISKVAVKAEKSDLNIHAVCEDIVEFIMDGSAIFDLVVAVTVLGHLPGAVLDDAAEAIVRVIKADGGLFAEEFTKDDPGFRRQRDASELANLVRSYFHPAELEEMFGELDIALMVTCDVLDSKHGPTHRHNMVRMIAEKK